MRTLAPAATLALTLLFSGCSSTPQPLPATAQRQTASLADASSMQPNLTGQTLYVLNGASNSIVEFSTTQSGNVAPIRTIRGTATKLTSPNAIAVDSKGHIFVSNGPSHNILEFSRTASGNAAPIATIGGKATHISDPVAIAFDPSGNLFVADYFNNQVHVFAPGSTGNVKPFETIAGSNTHLANPDGLTLAPNDVVFVSDKSAAAITAYWSNESGNLTPIATIAGSNTGLVSPGTMSYFQHNGAGYILVADPGAHAVKAWYTGANGNAFTYGTLIGSNTLLETPSAARLALSGRLFVADSTRNAVYAYDAFGNVAPVVTISGSKTLLKSPAGLTIH